MRLTFLIAGSLSLLAQVPGSRWKIAADGGISWEVHQDHIEMSGRRVSLILTYGVRENGSLSLARQLVFPSLRTIPNDTHASLSYTFADDATPRIFLGGRSAGNDLVAAVHIRGIVTIDSTFGGGSDVTLRRAIFPSTSGPFAMERYTFTNRGAHDASVEVESTQKSVRTFAARGVSGEYLILSEVLDPAVKVLKPGESATFAIVFAAREASASPPIINVEAEEKARRDRVEGILSKLRLETPDPVLNTAFAFAKIRTTESIYETKGGLMHGPGGGA